MVKFSAFREEEESVPDWEELMRASKRIRVTETSSIQQTEEEERGSEEGIVEGVDDSTIGVSSKAVSVILSDPDVLDCSICFEPLTIPVFQCENGHTACRSCCVKLKSKCPSCSEKIGHNRCRAIEKVIESVKIQCCYVNYGCKEVHNNKDVIAHVMVILSLRSAFGAKMPHEPGFEETGDGDPRLVEQSLHWYCQWRTSISQRIVTYFGTKVNFGRRFEARKELRELEMVKELVPESERISASKRSRDHEMLQPPTATVELELHERGTVFGKVLCTLIP
ncbi:LOW QUALITY PROTEIN: hypothetical protein Nepgr_032456 [Nepenthes gracilis]|uniref:RING-type domain-containing protein n=1 Tax=Nepenthes gracilis TaxID=150966 RepID=A0AAD3Y623_NEPGR|nr:LOW QUALITY PROTEIN: hypothetical protein Nepgr_032456 [Nepenthes gracilis]